jgi:hypothetical protein
LHYYASTASDNPEEDVCVDPELPFKFAYNFPAVLLTTGKREDGGDEGEGLSREDEGEMRKG